MFVCFFLAEFWAWFSPGLCIAAWQQMLNMSVLCVYVMWWVREKKHTHTRVPTVSQSVRRRVLWIPLTACACLLILAFMISYYRAYFNIYNPYEAFLTNYNYRYLDCESMQVYWHHIDFFFIWKTQEKT